jgi:carboxypeptidase Q
MNRLFAHLRFAVFAGFSALAVLACASGTEPESTAALLRDRALADTTAYRLVESLTTDVGARPAGSAADGAAVAWAVARFHALGYDKVYTEPVTFPAWRRVAESASVTAPAPHRLLITALGGSVGSGGPLQADLIAFEDVQALQAASPAAVEGRIVLLTRRMARRADGSGYAAVLPMRSAAASIAARKGARALLIRSPGTDNNRLPHTGSVVYEGGAAIPAAAVSGPDADLLERLLRGARPVEVRLDIEVDTDARYTSYNVIGEVTGKEPTRDVVMMGAHLDSWDLGTGAVDDGFGVAVTMAAGAMIKAARRVPARTVRVVLFANEENGFDGAQAYAARYAADRASHRIAVESDWGAGRIYALRHVPADPVLTGRLTRVLQPLGIALDGAEGVPGPDIAFIAKRRGPWAQLAQDATDLFDHHHSANDTLDKIDPVALQQNVAAYAAFAWLMAN